MKKRLAGKGKQRRYSSGTELQAVRVDGTDVRKPWLRSFLPLLACYASPTALADDLSVSYQTLYRWGVLGEAIPENKQKLLRFVAIAKGVDPPV